MAKEMKTFQIGALVRDKRVGLFEKDGCKVAYTKLAPAAADEKLRGKVMEEATELALSEEEGDLLKEAADVVETVLALLSLNGFDQDDLAKKMAERREKLGGFEGRIFIDTLTAPVGSETYEYHKANSDKYPEVDA
jgi:phosphoribosyl-ATP pyrophosphohydrolase